MMELYPAEIKITSRHEDKTYCLCAFYAFEWECQLAIRVICCTFKFNQLPCLLLTLLKADMDRIRYYNDNLGTHISPFDSWLALRGVRTLPLRLKKQSENAMAIAKWLEKRPEVEFVIYPGLESHPQHELAKKLFDGDNFGGMVCFHLKGGYEEMSAFADATKIPPIATSLGDVVTLIYPKKPYNNLIRLSTGIEDVNDLIADFEQAFEAIKK